jgi:hypothetical protein
MHRHPPIDLLAAFRPGEHGNPTDERPERSPWYCTPSSFAHHSQEMHRNNQSILNWKNIF